MGNVWGKIPDEQQVGEDGEKRCPDAEGYG